MRYYRPDTLTDALGWLAETSPRIAAGCTDLFPSTAAQALSGPVLDITALKDLRAITRADATVRVGANVTWTDLVRASLPAAFDGLKAAAREVGSIQIQNVATLVGNICNASPAADGIPGWLTLDARVELRSTSGMRELALADFVLGPRKTARRPDELVTAILVPDTATTGRSGFMKLGARTHLVISIAMCAARIVEERGTIRDARVAVGSCSAVAQRLPAVETALIGAAASDNASVVITDAMVQDALSPIDDLRSSAAYRADAATELVRRTITMTLQSPETSNRSAAA
ncbi:MAG: FAD binding domain-containing protein [Pseudomonadota bacterium]